MSPLLPLPPTFAATVAALHSVAERIVAPARKPDNEIALEATPGGFGTPVFEHEGVAQQVRVDGVELVRTAGSEERRTGLTTLEEARRLVADLVPAGPLSREPLVADRDAAARLAEWYAFGAAILEEIADASPTLWPEHFDIAIEMGEATYGFSPGDEQHPEPYAYVGPWNADVSGELWQAHGFRGAELTYAELLASPDQRAAVLDFLTSRKEALA
jgi:hypothetical protein